jgi:peroxiredoxin Q/BCP|tara:strand:- start:1255 stop:1740 length:486 start_codon:yes stop_codon:yes gene_type:complete
MTDDCVTLEEGEKAPDFKAKLTDGSEISLLEILGNGEKVILYFYPKDNTPGCTTQACDFRDNFGQLKQSGYRVIGVSKDSSKSHQNFIEKHDLNFDLIVDNELHLHQAYGVWREKKMYGKTFLGVIRSTFVIDTDGTLQLVWYNARAKDHVQRLKSELGIE